MAHDKFIAGSIINDAISMDFEKDGKDVSLSFSLEMAKKIVVSLASALNHSQGGGLSPHHLNLYERGQHFVLDIWLSAGPKDPLPIVLSREQILRLQQTLLQKIPADETKH